MRRRTVGTDFCTFFGINFMTSEAVPLLSLDQIEELAGMVRSIQAENRSDLDEVLSERVEIEHTSIMNLYNLTAEEWIKKQRIIDNLCHFALTIMNSIQLLWEQNHDLQSQLAQAEATVEQLQRTLVLTNDENDNFKETIEETQLQLEAIVQERDKIQDFCRSLSCIELPQIHEETLPKQLSAVFQQEELKHRQDAERLLQEKLAQIESLKDGQRHLQEEFASLKEEQELTRMEMELAEIAVQEALTYKHSYLEMVSQISHVSAPAPPQETNKKKESKYSYLQENSRFYAPKSSNSLGEDLSELCPLHSHLMPDEPPFEHSQQEEQTEEEEHSLIRLSSKEERQTAHCSPSPFCRKNEPQQEQSRRLGTFEESSIMLQHESVVIMQSSLDMTLSSEGQERPNLNSSSRLQLKSNHRRRPSEVPVFAKVTDMRRNKANRTTMPTGVPIYMSDGSNEAYGQVQGGALGRLYNLLSTKLVTNRIRKR